MSFFSYAWSLKSNFTVLLALCNINVSKESKLSNEVLQHTTFINNAQKMHPVISENK